MPILIAFVALVLGNSLLASWGISQIPELSLKILYAPIFYLYLPVGAFYFICRFDELTAHVDSASRRTQTLWFVLPVLYFFVVLALLGGTISKGLGTLLMLPVLIGLPIADIYLIGLALASVAYIPVFYRVMIGMSVPRHPAHDIINSDRQIDPVEAASIAQSIEQSMQQSLGFSKLQLDIRNGRCNKLLAKLKSKVDFVAQQNRQREAERKAEIERLARPERERLEALARSASLDADLAERMVELIRENERRKRNGG